MSPAMLPYQAYCSVLTGPDAYMVLVQVTVCERSGALPLDANDSSPGLQALVRLYCSSPQQLGYVVAAPVAHTPAAADYCSTCGLELVARVNCHWAATTNDVARWQSCHSLTRLVPEPDKGYFSLSAADVVLGNLGGEEVVMKTSSNIEHEVCSTASSISL